MLMSDCNGFDFSEYANTIRPLLLYPQHKFGSGCEVWDRFECTNSNTGCLHTSQCERILRAQHIQYLVLTYAI